ncbi:MAG: type II toxin-antitoxin system YafQ family toxin [Prevotellaceae bacterium]|jgi:mRNA interferase YafQ|nr:type II toxin-antitoxin system YafQ family toxin [Prevotellaceae bacterium]
MKKSDVKSIITKNSLQFKYTVDVTNSFKKDFVDCFFRGLDTKLLVKAVEILATEGKLPDEYKPHPLRQNYQGFMECHIQPDWLLVWKQDDGNLTLLLTNTGSHSYIFGW